MRFIQDHLLSVIVFLPLCSALIARAFPRGEHTGVRAFALVVSLAGFALSLGMWSRFDPSRPTLQMVEQVSWIPSLGIYYAVGVDGLSLLLIVLTTFLAPLVVLSTYSSVSERVRESMVCLLLLQACMLGAFVATDLLLFYVFWQAMLIPMYFEIGVRGGRRRVYAPRKFVIYSMAGSLLMLLAIVCTVWTVKDAGGLTFEWAEIAIRLHHMQLGPLEKWLFLAFAVAFAIKVPLLPIEAPTGGSVILRGALLQLGIFGFLRYAFWLFPQAATPFLPMLAALAVLGILILIAQVTRRRFREPMSRVNQVLVMGSAVAAAGLIVAPPMGNAYPGGALIRPLAALGGMEPFHEVFAVFAVVAGMGVLFAAVCLLRTVQRIFFVASKRPENLRDGLVLAPLGFVAVALAVYPQPFLDVINPSVTHYAQEFRAHLELPPLPKTDAAQRSAMRTLPALPGHAMDAAPVNHELYQMQNSLPWRARRPGAASAGGSP